MEKNKVLVQLGSKLAKIRKEKGLTQDELGAIIGKDRSYVGLVETGHRNLTFSTLCAFANGLEVKIADIVIDINIE